jgi:hypothetical protein
MEQQQSLPTEPSQGGRPVLHKRAPFVSLDTSSSLQVHILCSLRAFKISRYSRLPIEAARDGNSEKQKK